jgi:hypothetical protein
MNDAQLIEAVRYACGVDTNDPDYGDTRLRRELNETMLSTFSRVVVSSTEGYWKHCRTWPLQSAVSDEVGSTRDYPIFHRASVGGLVTAEVRESSTTDFRPLTRASQSDAGRMDSRSGPPTHYQDFHDYIRIYPASNVIGWSLRQWFYVRPSVLTELQPVDYGRITSVNYDTQTLVIAAMPIDRTTGVRPPGGATAFLIDVVHPKGIHALHLIEAQVTATVWSVESPSSTLTFGDNADGSELDITRVRVGDYVRIANQSEWPPLPQEFHQTLADAAAAAILMRQGAGDKARLLSEKVQSDLQRMQDLIDPRIKESPRYLKHRYGPLAHGGRAPRWAR